MRTANLPQTGPRPVASDTLSSILATALEAVLGAIYGEGGLGAVWDVIGRLAAW
jgi:dsRNA-specific ribonuclease